jgi:hypothetical protein
MARISSYPRDLEVNDNDAWIGTESSNRLTRNFTAKAVADYLNIKGKISISGQMVFKFTEDAPPLVGAFSGPADGSALTAITTMQISGIDSSGQNTVAFMQYLVGNDILISEQNNIDEFGHFKITGYTLNGTVYTLNLTNIGGNGSLDLNKYYDFATFTISTGVGDKNFVFTQAVASDTWVIQHDLNKFPSVTSVNINNFEVYGEVVFNNINNLTINFSGAFSGKAFIN